MILTIFWIRFCSCFDVNSTLGGTLVPPSRIALYLIMMLPSVQCGQHLRVSRKIVQVAVWCIILSTRSWSLRVELSAQFPAMPMLLTMRPRGPMISRSLVHRMPNGSSDRICPTLQITLGTYASIVATVFLSSNHSMSFWYCFLMSFKTYQCWQLRHGNRWHRQGALLLYGRAGTCGTRRPGESLYQARLLKCLHFCLLQQGEDEYSGNYNNFVEYDRITGTWSSLRTMPLERGHASSSTIPYACGFLIMGGSTNTGKTTDISYYDIPTDVWVKVGDMNKKVNTPACVIYPDPSSMNDLLHCESPFGYSASIQITSDTNIFI